MRALASLAASVAIGTSLIAATPASAVLASGMVPVSSRETWPLWSSLSGVLMLVHRGYLLSKVPRVPIQQQHAHHCYNNSDYHNI